MESNSNKNCNSQSQTILNGATVTDSTIGEINQNINQTNLNQTHSASGYNIAGDKNINNNFQGAKFGGGYAQRDYNGDVYNIINNLSQPPTLTSIPQNIPHQGTQTFVGHGDELQEISEFLDNSSQVAISSGVKSVTGMGGIGKTELAVQYALRNQEKYQGGICWVEARSQEISLQIISFCRNLLNLNPPDDSTPEDKVKFCWNHWHEGQVLLIFDDVQSYDSLKAYLPPKNDKFKVIVTSRQRLGQLSQLKLKVLKPEEALKLLQQIIGEDRVNGQLADGEKLCQWLGYLPLGLELVARYLVTYDTLSLEKVLQRLDKKTLEAKPLLDPKEDETDMVAQLGVASAFELSYDRLSDKAKELGCYLSLFKADEFAWDWVIDSSLFPNEDKEEEIEELEELRDGELRKFSLLDMAENKKSLFLQSVGISKSFFNFHPLIARYFTSKLKNLPKSEEFKLKFCQILTKLAISIDYQPTKQKIVEFTIITPHLITITIEMIDNAKDKDLIYLFVSLGKYYFSQGMYQKVEPYCKKYLEFALTKFTDIHLYTANAYNALGIISYYQDNYQEAEDNYHKSLNIRQKLLLGDHRDIADSFNNLGQLYLTQRNYKKAEDYLIKALKIRERLYQREFSDIANLDIAQSLANLAGLYCKKSELLKSSSINRGFRYLINPHSARHQVI